MGKTVTLLQSWLILGVPGLVIVGALFVGRSSTRALAGYAVLLLIIAYFVTVPGGGLSAALVGLIGVAFVASGRGTNLDDRYTEHHENRKRYTVAEERT